MNPFQTVLQEYTEAYKRLDAFNAPTFNVEELLGEFGDYPSPAFFERWRALCHGTAKKLKAIDSGKLSEKDQLLFRLLSEDIEVTLQGFHYPRELIEFNQMDNRLHTYLDDSSPELTRFPFDSVKHYDDFVSRSRGLSAYVTSQIELLRRGILEKVTLTHLIAERTINTYKAALEKDIHKNPFWRPITVLPKSFSEADRKRISENFTMMIRDRILPEFQRFDHFFKTEYLPHCRKSGYGIGELPNGKNWYQNEIRKQSDLGLEPEKIHLLGIQEVERIGKEIEEIKNKMQFKGSLLEFMTSLKNDRKYIFSTAKSMFDAFVQVKAKVNARIPTYFSTIPKSAYTIVETSNPEDAAARYLMPTESLPYGRFVVNTKNLKSVPVYDVTSLSLHEAVPGHHFQLAVLFEQKETISEYQRLIYISNSFVEGWALYAEHLGNEMGLFEDPLQRLGNLNAEMLRAVRLVVDTGIHAKGWSHDKATAYMREHLASDPAQIENEANRYSVWPGQALGYKLGQLKIIELRKLAEEKLGSRFDIREFHKRVIGAGTLSLNTLEFWVRSWIER